MIVLEIVSPAQKSMRALSAFARVMAPDDVLTLDLSHRDVFAALTSLRKLCGDCGPCIPTKQDLCPRCGGGYLEPFDFGRRAVMRRLRDELQRMA
jgi:hypothetical protein